ncbi:MAG TPA: 16S rRNA (guanine(966)-N(2))-methyltransferase RsmD, partial [Eubacterium sp.]|nr:16S rRNA (guanine(966)-N(2))-methyltransferase RsmD [Eubacterium sp.]
SRGAKEAVLVENARQAIAVIKDNLTFTKLSPKAVVMEQDVLSAINRLSGSGVFDIIFMDPPYDKLYEKDVLIFLSKSD